MKNMFYLSVIFSMFAQGGTHGASLVPNSPEPPEARMSPTVEHIFSEHEHQYNQAPEVILAAIDRVLTKPNGLKMRGAEELKRIRELSEYYGMGGFMHAEFDIDWPVQTKPMRGFFEQSRFAEDLIIAAPYMTDLGEEFYKWLPKSCWKKLDLTGCPQFMLHTREKISKAWADAGKDLSKLTFPLKHFVTNVSVATRTVAAVSTKTGYYKPVIVKDQKTKK